MNQQELLKWATERKVQIDQLSDGLAHDIARIAQEIRDAGSTASNIPQLQGELKGLQDRLGTEPEKATRLLCSEIEQRSDLNNVFKRNTDATNKSLKGENWAKFVIGIEVS